MITGATSTVMGVVFAVLLKTGIHMDIETLKVLAGWTSPVIAAILTYFAAKHKLKNDSKTTDMANLITRMDKMQTRLDQVEKELREERSARAKDSSRIQSLEDDIRDRDELIVDLVDHIITTDEWVEDGAAPPSPPKPWRVKAHLKARPIIRPTTGNTPSIN